MLINGDFRKYFPKDESVDLVVTSPPYKNEDGYSEALMIDAAIFCRNALKGNGLVFVNFGHLAEDKFRPFQVCQLFIDVGFKLNETFVWVKNHYRPIQGNKRVNNLSEFIFLLYKGKMPNLDRLSIGVPYKDKSNAKRFADGRDLKCQGNVWHIPYETVQKSKDKLHNDRFPLQLPENCIKLSGIPAGSLVMDPFAGSGTTLLAAQKLKMNTLGYEINQTHYKTAIERLKNDSSTSKSIS